MVKVLTITPFFPPDIGGIANHVLNLNTNLVKRRNDVFIVTPKHPWNKVVEHSGDLKAIRINSIYLPGWPYQTLRSLSIPVDFGAKIRSIMKKGDFDIVHVHDHHYPISWFAINSAYKYGIPSVLTIHAMYQLNPLAKGGKTLLEEYFNKYVFTKLLSKTNLVIGTTEEAVNYAKRFGNESIKYFTIPNGVNTTVFKDNLKRKNEYRQKYGIDNDKTVILFCGRFTHMKGIIEFVEATKKIIKNNRIEVMIVGGGPLESHVKHILKNLDRVHILSWQPMEKIHELYIASDVFVIPSRLEGQGITAIEAMNAALHVVYSPVGGIPDTVSGYPRKTMLKEVSSDEIQNTLTSLIPKFPNNDDIDSSLRYAQKFDWNQTTIDTIQVYTSCATQ